MEESNVLCERCATIPFEPNLTGFFDGTYDEMSWELGTFKEARSRSCPFCTLIVSICSVWAIGYGSWHPLEQPGDDEIITVRWFRVGFDAASHSRPGSFICVTDSHKSQDRLYTRERLDPWINWNEIRRWISECQSNHETCAGLDKSSLNFEKHRFRLIDVEEYCIVEATKSHTYVALSYVWGDPSDGRLLLLQDNQAILQQPKSLESFQLLIPESIRDAITVTKEIGQRYLWVDSLCLTQDDPNELRDCVTQMDKIYQEAIITIVGASGMDAHAGLPGTNPTTRDTQRLVREIMPGLRMGTIQDLDSWLRPSKYSQRGWTMQEEVLSRRKLFFINNQIYFRCRKYTLSEVMNTPGQPLVDFDRGFSLYSLLLSDDDGFADFAFLILYYTARSLSHDNDALRAALGMIHRYASLNKTDLIEGLPCPLDQSLLFWRVEPLKQGANPLNFRREGFPSYSWVGWRSTVDWDIALNEVVMHPDSSSNNSQSMEKYSNSDVVLRTWICWHVVYEHETFLVDTMGNRQPFRSSDTNNFLDQCRQEFRNYKIIREEHDVHQMCTGIPYTVIFFWTVCVNLVVAKPTKHDITLEPAMHYKHYDVLSCDGVQCGDVTLDTNFFEGEQEGFFALIAGTREEGFWALLLKERHNRQMERWGLAKLSSECLNGHSDGSPRWEKIFLV